LKEVQFHRFIRQLHLGDSVYGARLDDEVDEDFATMEVIFEPRPGVMIRDDVEPKDLVIVDDRGRSIVKPGPTPKGSGLDRGWWGVVSVARIPLLRETPRSRSIRQLRGIASVTVAIRQSVPLVIPLADAEGRSFQGVDSVVTVEKITDAKPRATARSKSSRRRGAGGRPAPTFGAGRIIELKVGPIDPGSSRALPDQADGQVEVVDAEGMVWKAMPTLLSNSRPRPQGREIKFVLRPADGNLSPWSGDLAGAKLRYYELAAMRLDVPFEFANVRLP
jgi:hypothetical protein